MLSVVPYRPVHLIEIMPKRGEPGATAYISPKEATELMAHDSFTVISDGRAVACCGLVRQWAGRYVAWAYIDRHAGKHLRFIIRRTEEMFNAMPKCRIEATVAAGFDAGHRLAKLLKFEPYSEILERYMPDGGDAVFYRRLVK